MCLECLPAGAPGIDIEGKTLLATRLIFPAGSTIVGPCLNLPTPDNLMNAIRHFRTNAARAAQPVVVRVVVVGVVAHAPSRVG